MNQTLPMDMKIIYQSNMNERNPPNPNEHTKLRILYCPACVWMLRSAWIAQEVLSTFTGEVSAVSLEPAAQTPGLFQVWLRNSLIWCRKKDKGFPQAKELKKKIRDILCPERNLGHLDQKN